MDIIDIIIASSVSPKAKADAQKIKDLTIRVQKLESDLAETNTALVELYESFIKGVVINGGEA